MYVNGVAPSVVETAVGLGLKPRGPVDEHGSEPLKAPGTELLGCGSAVLHEPQDYCYAHDHVHLSFEALSAPGERKKHEGKATISLVTYSSPADTICGVTLGSILGPIFLSHIM